MTIFLIQLQQLTILYSLMIYKTEVKQQYYKFLQVSLIYIHYLLLNKYIERIS